jgi:formylglycine-generating enzyme required for sulfatase activity
MAIERLLSLVDELRRAGYPVGVEQCLAAQDLLLALAARDALPDDRQGLATLLGPIFCKSPAQQEDFRARFDRWAGAPGVGLADATHQGALHEALRDNELGSWVWTLVLAVSVVAVHVALSLTLTRSTRPPAGKAPAAVRMHAARPGPPVAEEVQPGPVVEAHPDFLGAIKRPTGGANVSAAARPSSRVPTDTGRRSRIATAMLLVVTLPLVALAAWRFWWARRARLFLSRRTATGPPELGRVAVRGVRGRLYRGEGLTRTTRDLSRRRPVPSHDLDVVATVEATVRHAGWFTPHPGRRRAVPEYLVLVDRAGYRDHQARLVNELLDRLVDDGLHVTRYFFDGDPRVCHTGWSGVGATSARELAGRYSNHRLLVVSDGAGLVSPLTGEPVAWSDQFGRWPERVLLTPEPLDRWGDRECALAGLGWTIMPATEDGLTAIAGVLNFEPPAPLAGARPSLPLLDIIGAHPRRWLGRLEPRPDELDRLLEGLRDYLGEADFEWLAACAIYPELHWDLTLFIGTRLGGAEGRPPDPARIAALARLPWFRHGAMPDWLRTRLVGAMSPARERDVRRALQALFLTALERPADGLELEIAHDRRGTIGRLATRVFRILRDSAPDDSPLRDLVFAAVMTGHRPPRLGLSLPLDLLGLLSDLPAHLAPRRAATPRSPVLLLRFAVPILTASLLLLATLPGLRFDTPSTSPSVGVSIKTSATDRPLVASSNSVWLPKGYEVSEPFEPAPDAPDEAMRLRRLSDNVEFYRLKRGVYLPVGYEPESNNMDDLVEVIWPRVIVRTWDKMVRFIRISGKTYRRGDPRTNTGPLAHWVRVSGFYIQETEVTNGEIEGYLESYPKAEENLRTWREYYKTVRGTVKPIEKAKRFPAACISYLTAETYAEDMAGRLPTEAEWECAAKSGNDNNIFPWGPEFPKRGEQPKANIMGPGKVGPAEVQTFRYDKTDDGVFDMAGNVRELCLDAFRPYQEIVPPENSTRLPLIDPRQGAEPRPDRATRYVVRGGGYISSLQKAQVFYRDGIKAAETAGDVGFRVVIECPPVDSST